MTFELDPKDVHVDSYRRLEDYGFMHKPTAGVRVIHVPTGVSVTEAGGRSVHMNRAEAMRKLTVAVQAIINQSEPGQPKTREPMTAAEYVADQGSHCPFCRSRDTHGHSIDFDSGEMTQEMICGSCNKEWQDNWGLVGYTPC